MPVAAAFPETEEKYLGSNRAALIVAAAKAGLHKHELDASLPRLAWMTPNAG